MERFFIVASTHWDREWYRSFEEFRIRLCDVVNCLLEALEQDNELRCFTFDGQCVVLEDYLEIYPQNREKLARHIREGRLVVGPAYVIPDELVPSGEGLIRNFLIGDAVCRAFGAKSQSAYLPDNFGHTSQMPQILHGSGLQAALFLRGMDTDTCAHSEFFWEGADGTRVLSVHLPLGYWNLKSWGKLGKDPVAHFREVWDTLKKFSSTQAYLLINGSDHLYYDPAITANIRQVRAAFPDISVENTSIDAFIAEVQKRLEPARLRTVTGELRYGKNSPLNESCTSAQYAIKAANDACESELEKYTEPLCTLALVQGADYPEELLDAAWKKVLKNYAHDSICGCSADAAMTDVVHRYRHAQQIAGRLSELALDTLCRPADELAEAGSILVYNPLGWSRDDMVTAVIDIPAAFQARDVVITDPHGEDVPFELLGVEETAVLSEYRYLSKKKTCVTRFRVRFPVRDIPAVGYVCYRYAAKKLRDKRAYQQWKMLTGAEPFIENEFYKITPQPNGSVTILHKPTGHVYPDMHRFTDRGDSGNEYQSEVPFADSIVYGQLKAVSVERNTPLSSTLRMDMELLLPVSLDGQYFARSEQRVVCPLTTWLTLDTGTYRIDIRTELDNQVRDHVLSVHFPTAVQSAYDYAHMPFDTVRRRVEIQPVAEDDNEILTPFKPMQVFADIHDAQRGVQLSAKGLYEYRTRQGEHGLELSVTLLRCVGWMFRDTPTASRDGQPCTTPVVATPTAQNAGRQTFSYSLTLYGGGEEPAAVRRQAFAHHYPLRAVAYSGEPRPAFSLVEADNPHLLISCVKKSRENALLIRLYNSSEQAQSGKLIFGIPSTKVAICDMLEHNLKELEIVNNTVAVTAGQKEILNYIVEWKG